MENAKKNAVLCLNVVFNPNHCLLCSISFRLGMPDDCTVIVAHIVGRDPDDLMDKEGL